MIIFHTFRYCLFWIHFKHFNKKTKIITKSKEKAIVKLKRNDRRVDSTNNYKVSCVGVRIKIQVLDSTRFAHTGIVFYFILHIQTTKVVLVPQNAIWILVLYQIINSSNIALNLLFFIIGISSLLFLLIALYLSKVIAIPTIAISIVFALSCSEVKRILLHLLAIFLLSCYHL